MFWRLAVELTNMQILHHRRLKLFLWAVGMFLMVMTFSIVLNPHKAFAATCNQLPCTQDAAQDHYEEVAVAGGGLSLNAPVAYYQVISNNVSGSNVTFSFQIFSCPPATTFGNLATNGCNGVYPGSADPAIFSINAGPCGTATLDSQFFFTDTWNPVGSPGGWSYTYPTSCVINDGNGYYSAQIIVALQSPAPHQLYAYKFNGTNGNQFFYDTSTQPGTSLPFAEQQRGATAGVTTFDIPFTGGCQIPAAGAPASLNWFDADGYPSYSPQNWSIAFTLTDTTTGGLAAGPIGSYTSPAIGGNLVPGAVGFTMQQNHAYDWQWTNVLFNNGIQFYVPADSVVPGGASNCAPLQPPTQPGFTNVSGQVYVGSKTNGLANVGIHSCLNQYNEAAYNPQGGNYIQDMATTPDGDGYWLVGADGGVFSFGDAGYYGSIPGLGGTDHYSNGGSYQITGIASTPDGKGYWLVGSDGDVYAFGDAAYLGGAPSHTGTIQGIAASPDGYWLVGSDGGVFSIYPSGKTNYFYGSVVGSLGAGNPYGPGKSEIITGITASLDNKGYAIVGSDGGVFAYGDIGFHGRGPKNAVGIAHTSFGSGYYFVNSNGVVSGTGDAFTFITLRLFISQS